MAEGEEIGPRITLGGNMPDDVDNGFAQIIGELSAGADKRRRYVTIAVFEVASTKINRAKGNVRSETLRLVSVEPLDGADRDQALAMHDRLHGERTGEVTLGAVAGESPA